MADSGDTRGLFKGAARLRSEYLGCNLHWQCRPQGRSWVGMAAGGGGGREP